MVGKVDGVFDSKGNVIKKISKDNLSSVRKALLSSDGVADVTGGMVHKVEKSLEIGVEVEIINGLKPSILKRSLMGEKGLGTTIKS
jgi:isopentenyl phosphate kinase